MRTITVIALAVAACSGGNGRATATDTVATEVAAPSPVVDPRWDPATPVETSELEIHTLFVVVARSALCPTRDQAKARECGNSVEFADQGTIEAIGSAIRVVGDAPIDGMWKALRYQKGGVMPGWIAAEDVAETPSTTFLDRWDRSPALEGAIDVSALAPAELAKLRKGTLVKWPRSRHVRFGAFGDRLLLYLVDAAGIAAVELPEPPKDGHYVDRHSCLVHGDCIRLSYICNDGYCDEVSILAKATGSQVPPPDDPEDEWAGARGVMPVFEVVSIADRFGVFP